MKWFSTKIKPIQNIKVYFHCVALHFFSIVSMVVVSLVIEKCTGYYLIPMRSTMSNNPHTCMKLGHWTKHVTTISTADSAVYLTEFMKMPHVFHFLSHIFLWWWMDLQNWTKLCACVRARAYCRNNRKWLHSSYEKWNAWKVIMRTLLMLDKSTTWTQQKIAVILYLQIVWKQFPQSWTWQEDNTSRKRK